MSCAGVRTTPDLGIVHLGIAESDLRATDLEAFTYPWFDRDA